MFQWLFSYVHVQCVVKPQLAKKINYIWFEVDVCQKHKYLWYLAAKLLCIRRLLLSQLFIHLLPLKVQFALIQTNVSRWESNRCTAKQNVTLWL